MADLKTDYKDDVLDVSVNEKRKWIITENGDGTVTIEDATTYSQTGDIFGSADLNSITLAINECFQSVSNGKTLLASAITDKRVATDATATFAKMAENIAKIVLGSGNATKADVLSGKTFTNSDGVEYTGEMTNNGAKTASLNCGGSYTIPSGYHNGNGKVTANTLASQTRATAIAENITKGKTAWINGVKITGTRPVPKTSQNGTITKQVNNWGTATGTKNFSSTFDKPPKVIATAVDSDGDSHNVEITKVTEGGFNWSCYHPEDNTTTLTITWNATG